MHRHQHFRRVGHLTQPLAGHLENSQFRRGAETVLYASQQAVSPLVVTLELEHHVHDMFQDLRSSDVAVLGNMADENHRHAGHFRIVKQHCRHFLNLRNRACGRIDIGGKHGLNRVHDHQVRLQRIRLRNDVAYVCLTVNEAVGVISAKPVGTHFHLPRALLARHVQCFQRRRAQRNLKGQCGFADAGLAAYQDQ